MQEIRSVSAIKDGEDECLVDYYMLLLEYATNMVAASG